MSPAETCAFVPLLMLFAAKGITAMWGCVCAGELKKFGAYVLVSIAVAVGVNVRVYDQERLDALSWMNVGVSVAQTGDVAGATPYFRRAVSAHPTSSEANMNLAMSLALQKDYVSAIPHYRAALAGRPALIGADYNLAVALERVGKMDEALAHYRRAVAVDASDEDARRAVLRLEGKE